MKLSTDFIATCEALAFPALISTALLSTTVLRGGSRQWEFFLIGGYVTSFLLIHGLYLLGRKKKTGRILALLLVAIPFYILSYCEIWYGHSSLNGRLHKHTFWDVSHVH